LGWIDYNESDICRVKPRENGYRANVTEYRCMKIYRWRENCCEALENLARKLLANLRKKHIHIFEYVDTSPKNQLGPILACLIFYFVKKNMLTYSHPLIFSLS